jgi:hypothetical protein
MLEVLTLLGSVFWACMEHGVTLFILIACFHLYNPRNDADQEHVPKRLREPSGVLGRTLLMLTSWVERLAVRVSQPPTPGFLSSSQQERRRKFKHRQRILFCHAGSPSTPRRRSKPLSLLACSAVCMTTEAVHAQSLTGSFDTDSKPIGIDNRCTACISHDATDFVGNVLPSNRWIKGFGGSKTTNV